MQRIVTEPRPGWPALVEAQGLHYHTQDGERYWDESAYYAFSPLDVERIEKATYALNELCLQAVQHVVDHHRELFPRFSIPEPFYDFFLRSWEQDEFTLYGRYDLAYDGQSPPKLLEFNADTPTALLEAAVIQWYWLEDFRKKTGASLDQFNSIHERLIEAWRRYRPQVNGWMHFTATAGHLEDYMTVNYLRDTAMQAGLLTGYLDVDDIRWDARRSLFVQGVGEEGDAGYQEFPIHNLFKLYPWEWLIREAFGPFLQQGGTRWLEAPWKLLLSNKAILPVLYQLAPDCPYLLRAEFEPFGVSYARKPTMGREGACLTLVRDGSVLAETDGLDFYRQSPCIYQELHVLPEFDGNYPMVGSWLVNGWACGVGIREDTGLVTGNTSRFLPHVISG